MRGYNSAVEHPPAPLYQPEMYDLAQVVERVPCLLPAGFIVLGTMPLRAVAITEELECEFVTADRCPPVAARNAPITSASASRQSFLRREGLTTFF